jgi:superfamily II DNA or RNA helicase
MIERYLNAAAGAAALVRMPTGTGKTGVMATVGHFLSGHNVLVVVPWAQLRDQIQEELRADFWRLRRDRRDVGWPHAAAFVITYPAVRA